MLPGLHDTLLAAFWHSQVLSAKLLHTSPALPSQVPLMVATWTEQASARFDNLASNFESSNLARITHRLQSIQCAISEVAEKAAPQQLLDHRLHTACCLPPLVPLLPSAPAAGKSESLLPHWYWNELTHD